MPSVRSNEMAIHDTIASMLKESLREYLHVAEFCITYRKDIAWGSNQVGGCLGWPGTALMFCILDTIGSYYRDRKDFFVKIDGKNRTIKNDSYHHFFMLNSEYYKQQLGEVTIKKLYENYRNLLLHNAALAMDHFLFIGDSNAPPFPVQDNRPHVNVTAFLQISKEAVALFLQRIDEVVNKSDQVRIIKLKR
jgi:hypothetical protein